MKSSEYNKTNESEERALNLYAEMMIEKIEGFVGNWQKPWFTEGALSIPINADGREYNASNAFMLMMYCEKMGYKNPIFMTFDRISKFNYEREKTGEIKEAKDADGNKLPFVKVNKGEKSFPVFLTIINAYSKENHTKISYDDYKRLSEEEREEYYIKRYNRVYNVYNIDQTNLKESRPEFYETQINKFKLKFEETKTEEREEFSISAVDAMIKDDLFVCPIKSEYQNEAFYSISGDYIKVPEKSQFISDEAFYGTLFHEMSHSTGSENRFNRFNSPNHSYAREELVAEMSAALLLQSYGKQKYLKEDSVAYLKAWLSSMRKEPEFIKTCLEDVKKASDFIKQRIYKVDEVIKRGSRPEDIEKIREENRFQKNTFVKPQQVTRTVQTAGYESPKENLHERVQQQKQSDEVKDERRDNKFSFRR